MEKLFTIPTLDNHRIYGVLNYPSRTHSPAEPTQVVCFIHSLSGHMHEHVYFNAARYFTNYGLATCRFDLYSGEKDARRLQDSTITTHVSDTDLIIEMLAKNYEHIGLVGHSLGGIVALMTKMDKIKALTLWEPTYDLSNQMEAWGIGIATAHGRILDFGQQIIIGEQMYHEMKECPRGESLIATLDKPVKIIAAEKGVLVAGCTDYFRNAKQPKELAIIHGAGHNFNEEGTEEELFHSTMDWFSQWLTNSLMRR